MEYGSLNGSLNVPQSLRFVSLVQRRPNMESPRLKYRFAPFYNDVAVHPELPKFRTLVPQWTKKLFDDIEEVLQKEQAVNDALAKKYGMTVMTVLDCPRSLIRDDPEVYGKWKEYEHSLQTYCEACSSLCILSRG
jgi:hypothetical protein